MLIVIAVTAILAISTIVSYFGIAEQAYNTKITDGVNQYIDAIKGITNDCGVRGAYVYR